MRRSACAGGARCWDQRGNDWRTSPARRYRWRTVPVSIWSRTAAANPPVCKILDLGKYKYEIQKKKNEARKKQKVIEVKEIKMRPSIDEHDYQVKMRSMRRFLDEGDRSR